MRATPLIIGGLDSSSLLALAVFAEENSWSRSLKKAQKKTSVWLFPLLYITRESGTIINYRALRFVLRII